MSQNLISSENYNDDKKLEDLDDIIANLKKIKT